MSTWLQLVDHTALRYTLRYPGKLRSTALQPVFHHERSISLINSTHELKSNKSAEQMYLTSYPY